MARRHVREQMARLLEESGYHDVIGAFAWGSLSHEQTRCSLRLFAEEVMPAFSGSPAPVAQGEASATEPEHGR